MQNSTGRYCGSASWINNFVYLFSTLLSFSLAGKSGNCVSSNIYRRMCDENYSLWLLAASHGIFKECLELARFHHRYDWVSFITLEFVHQAMSIFDPLGQPEVAAGRDHCFPSVRPHFSNLAKQNNRKQCSLLARLWFWPSGSLLYSISIQCCEYNFVDPSN